jgi:DNA-binding CsgD family transcriptional regulator
MRSLLFRFLERLLLDLGLKRTSSRVFELDEELSQSVQNLAHREGRLPGEVASGLVAEALDRRRASEMYLLIWGKLSQREQQVAVLVCQNDTNSEIAKKLMISESTVKTHLRRILEKFGLGSKDELRLVLSHWDFNQRDD